MKMWLTCREATRLISDGLDRDLGVVERAALRVHVALCDACTRFTAQLAFLRRAVREYPGLDDEPKR